MHDAVLSRRPVRPLASRDRAGRTGAGHDLPHINHWTPSGKALAAGKVDDLARDIAPVLPRSGERIFDGVQSFGFEPVEVLHSLLITHIRYRRLS